MELSKIARKGCGARAVKRWTLWRVEKKRNRSNRRYAEYGGRWRNKTILASSPRKGIKMMEGVVITFTVIGRVRVNY